MTSMIAEFLRKDGKLNSRKLLNDRHPTLEMIRKKTTFLPTDVSWSQRFWHVKHEHNGVGMCVVCGHPTTFISLEDGYYDTCSNSCAQRNPATRKKIEQTSLDKYGAPHHLQNDDILKKQRDTVISKYGVNNVSQLLEVKEAKAQTCRRNHGTEYPQQAPSVRAETRSTVLRKYGVENVQMATEIRKKTKRTKTQNALPRILERISSKVSPLFDPESYNGVVEEYEFECKLCGVVFLANLASGRTPRCYDCYPLQNSSLAQRELCEFLDSMGIDYTENDRSVLDGRELDVYIPSRRMAIEYNGLYWHSEDAGNKDRSYHLSKTEECEKQGIHLIHIFEDEWVENSELVKRMLSHRLSLLDRSSIIYARQCDVVEISSKDKNGFLDKHHLQGQDRSTVKLGAMFGGKLVAVMTFTKPRISLGKTKKNSVEGEWELSRFCTNGPVMYIAPRLLSHFIDTHAPTRITTFADRRWSSTVNGTIYDKMGFTYTGSTDPNYWYIDQGRRKHRFGLRKSVLNERLDSFDGSLTEWENMKLNGYDRIWDCGNLRYIMEIG